MKIFRKAVFALFLFLLPGLAFSGGAKSSDFYPIKQDNSISYETQDKSIAPLRMITATNRKFIVTTTPLVKGSPLRIRTDEREEVGMITSLTLETGHFFNFEYKAGKGIRYHQKVENQSIQPFPLSTSITAVDTNVGEVLIVFEMPEAQESKGLSNITLQEMNIEREFKGGVPMDTDLNYESLRLMEQAMSRAIKAEVTVRYGEKVPAFFKGRVHVLSPRHTVLRDGVLRLTWKLKVEILEP